MIDTKRNKTESRRKKAGSKNPPSDIIKLTVKTNQHIRNINLNMNTRGKGNTNTKGTEL